MLSEFEASVKEFMKEYAEKVVNDEDLFKGIQRVQDAHIAWAKEFISQHNTLVKEFVLEEKDTKIFEWIEFITDDWIVWPSIRRAFIGEVFEVVKLNAKEGRSINPWLAKFYKERYGADV